MVPTEGSDVFRAKKLGDISEISHDNGERFGAIPPYFKAQQFRTGKLLFAVKMMFFFLCCAYRKRNSSFDLLTTVSGSLTDWVPRSLSHSWSRSLLYGLICSCTCCSNSIASGITLSIIISFRRIVMSIHEKWIFPFSQANDEQLNSKVGLSINQLPFRGRHCLLGAFPSFVSGEVTKLSLNPMKFSGIWDKVTQVASEEAI